MARAPETAAPARPAAPRDETAQGLEEPARTYPPVKVRALKDCYYDHIYRTRGSVFLIDGTPLRVVRERQRHEPGYETDANREAYLDRKDQEAPAAFSKQCMTLDPKGLERTGLLNEEIRRKHDDEIKRRQGFVPADDTPTGAEDPMGFGE